MEETPFYTGKEFKSIYKDVKLFILLDDDINNKFKLKSGLNILYYKNNLLNKQTLEVFSEPQESVSVIKLNFIDIEKFGLKVNEYVKYFREVELFDDSKIIYCCQYCFYKTDKFFLKDKQPIHKFEMWKDENYCLKIMKINPYILRYIRYTPKILNEINKGCKKGKEYICNIKKELQTYEMCYNSVKSNCYLFPYVREDLQSYEMCYYVVKKCNQYFIFVKKDLQNLNLFKLLNLDNLNKIDFFKNVCLLKYLNKDLHSYDIYLLIVKDNGYNIKYIDENIENYYNLCVIAVNNEGNSIQYIKKKLQDYNLCEIAVKNNPESFKYIRKDLQNNYLCKIAIDYNINILGLIRKDLQTYEICLSCIKINGHGLDYILKKFITKEMLDIIISKSVKK